MTFFHRNSRCWRYGCTWGYSWGWWWC